MSKIDKILDYMIEHGSITGLEALSKGINCYRLSSAIHVLRHKRNLDIETTQEVKIDSFGAVSRYGRYVLNDKQREELKSQRGVA